MSSAIIGFNHGMLCLVLNIALGPCFFRQNTSACGLGVLTPETRPSCYIENQAQHAMIKTYIIKKKTIRTSDIYKYVYTTLGREGLCNCFIMHLRSVFLFFTLLAFPYTLAYVFNIIEG